MRNCMVDRMVGMAEETFSLKTIFAKQNETRQKISLNFCSSSVIFREEIQSFGVSFINENSLKRAKRKLFLLLGKNSQCAID